MNLIMGLAYGYDFDRIKVFIHSLDASRFKGELVLFADDRLEIPDVHSRAFKIRLINPVQLRRSLPKRAMIKVLSTRPVLDVISRFLLQSYRDSAEYFVPLFGQLYDYQTCRYAFYQHFLRHHHYENVLLTDVRDVVFQSDPFANFHETFAGFQKSPHQTIRGDKINARAVRRAFGARGLDEIGDNIICCSGTIMGKRLAMLDFLDLFITTCLRQSIPFNHRGIDQAVFNYLVHTNQIGHITRHRQGDIVFTVSGDTMDRCEFRDGQLFFDAINPAIVHQYDRFENLVKFFGEFYNGSRIK